MDSITSRMFTGDTKTQLTIIFSSKPKVDAFLTYSEPSPFWKTWPFFWRNLSVFLTFQPNFETRNFSHFSTGPFNNYSKFSPLEKSFQISYSKSSPYRFSEDFFEIRLFKNLTIDPFSNNPIQKTHLLWNVGAYFRWNRLIQTIFKNHFSGRNLKTPIKSSHLWTKTLVFHKRRNIRLFVFTLIERPVISAFFTKVSQLDLELFKNLTFENFHRWSSLPDLKNDRQTGLSWLRRY